MKEHQELKVEHAEAKNGLSRFQESLKLKVQKVLELEDHVESQNKTIGSFQDATNVSVKAIKSL